MKTFIVSYGNGEVLITKVINAKSKTTAIKMFIEHYDQYDISKNEVDILEGEEFNENVEAVWQKIKEPQTTKK